MNEKIILKDKRFVTIKRYCELSGLSYATIDHMLKSGQLPYITTESGQRKVDTKGMTGDLEIVLQRFEKTEKMIAALCKQFNTSV